MAIGNINTKSGEKVNNYSLLVKVLNNFSGGPVKISYSVSIVWKVFKTFHNTIHKTNQVVNKILMMKNLFQHHYRTLMVGI